MTAEGAQAEMPKRNYLILFILALCLLAAVASLQKAPGYMDAEYYYSGSLQIARGKGFQENFIWNYLDSPGAAPHPAFTYWMPLASLLAAILPGLAGKIDFTLARIPFILIGASIAPLSAYIAYRLTRKAGLALFSGVLAAFPGYYLAYLTTTDTFGIYMLLGSAFLLLAAVFPARFSKDVFPKALLMGFTAGLMHLARADGLLWLGFAVLVIIWSGKNIFLIKIGETRGKAGGSMKKEGIGLIGAILCAGLGYLLVMAPWLLRNYAKYGTLLSPGASRAIWERSYNELFNYPPATLNFANWWAQGMSVLLRQRWEALLANLQTVLGVQMEILLAPFVAIGLWRMRKEKLVQLACLAWGFILFAMSVVYPFAGARGGFFHSGSAIQPVVWAAAACGFEAVIAWAARMRKWDAQTALNRFMPGISLFIILITAFNYLRVLGPDLAHPAWNGDVVYYGRIEAELRKMDPSQTASVMVNNPAGYSLVSERPAYVIPNGGSDTLLAVARRYQVRYVILDANLPDDLFAEVGATRTIPGLVDLAKIDQASILRVEEK